MTLYIVLELMLKSKLKFEIKIKRSKHKLRKIKLFQFEPMDIKRSIILIRKNIYFDKMRIFTYKNYYYA
ncbi:hypothetical protein BpHYR1_000420 [Brachionus plicatilis]|uniref:Uncharacterized protein n=1 Tax=Brachionus plicatilis TaxID=10195 RepID=A0A3M7RU81_BRAPC|nr:hypothetical protein BpHYR1_000420 [Brachionus plicatilis]